MSTDWITYSAKLPEHVYEINGSRTETFGQFEFSAKAEFCCRWDDRGTIVTELSKTVYNFPALDADNNFNSYYSTYYPAHVTGINVAPFGAEGVYEDTGDKTPVWQPHTLAKLSVDYKAIARPSNWTIQETVTPALSMRQLPTWGYYWRSDGSPILDAEAPAIMQIQAKISRHINGIHKIPEWFYDLAGSVNLRGWTDAITGVSYLPGTLLFNPSSMERNITLSPDDDDTLWNISFELSWNPIGWNNFQRPHGVDMMMYNGAPVYMYPVYDFPTLLLQDYNGAAINEFVGDPYYVELQNIDGTTYTIFVATSGELS